MSAPLILSGLATSVHSGQGKQSHYTLLSMSGRGGIYLSTVNYKCIEGYGIWWVWRIARIQSSRSISSDRFIWEVIVENMSRFWRLSGIGNSIFLSNRPGRRRAGSKVSERLVAIITLTLTDWSNPSIWFNSSSRIRCTSRSAVEQRKQ